MADEEYRVRARLDVDKNQAAQNVGGLIAQLVGLQRSTNSAASGISSLLRTVVGFGSAYVGVRALTSATRALVTESFSYASVLEKQRTSLGAILAATQPMYMAIADSQQRMAMAGKLGDAIFRQLQGDALKSVATGQELFGIYAAIAGPLAGAGAKLSEIRQITNDTVSAASVLGVDFGQASRDIMLMATGAAGMDTMLFRMLKSTNAIKEDAKAWNGLLPEERLKKIKTALAGYAPAAKAFEQTLPGITSSFVDFMQRFRGALMAGPLESLRKSLVSLVGIFQQHQDRILSLLTVMGNGFARFLDPVLNAFTYATEWLIANWDRIGIRIENSLARIKKFAGDFAPTAKFVGGAMLAKSVTPTALTGAAAGAATTGIKDLMVYMGTWVKQLRALGFGITDMIWPLAILAGIIGAVSDQWVAMVFFLTPLWAILQDVIGTVLGLAAAIGGALWPVLKIIGVVLVSSFVVLIGIVGAFFKIVWVLTKAIISVLTVMFEYINKGFTWVYDHIKGVLAGLAKFMGGVLDIGYDSNKPGQSNGSWMQGFQDSFKKAFEGFESQKKSDESLIAQGEQGAPDARKTTINDFRGSKIEVKQDFRSADPDRVWLQMVSGVNEAAERRLSSVLAPEYSR